MDATRRDVLRLAAGLGAGAVAGGCLEGSGLHRWWPVARDIFFARPPLAADTPRSEWGSSRVAAYRRLGRTGVHVSDISFGSAKVASPDVVREALERGISYFDTSPDYADAASERAIGEGIRGRRDEVFLATKFCTPAGHLPAGAPVAEIVRTLEGSLARLGTDHVDLVHIHACNEEERLFAPSFHEAFERLREQGKVRFLGVSSHTPRMVEVMTAAIESGRFDVVMPAYSFHLWPELDRVLELARARDVGVVAMKTLKGAWHEVLPELREDAASYAQSAFRWVLANPRVSCLVISISERRQIDEYLVASGQAPDPEDLGAPRPLRRRDGGAPLPRGLRRLPPRLPRGRPHRRRPARRDVRHALPRSRGRPPPLRRARRAGLALPRLRGALHRRLSLRPRRLGPYPSEPRAARELRAPFPQRRSARAAPRTTARAAAAR